MEDVWIQLPIILILIACSSFFSSSETALTSVSQIRLRQRASEGDKKSLQVLKLLERPQDLISSILIGNNIVNIAASAVATVFFTRLFGASGPVVATVVMTILVLIFGEVLPKTVAQEQPEWVSRGVSRPIARIAWFLRPLVFLLSALTSFMTRILFPDIGESPTITEEEFKTLVEVGEEEGVLQSEERTYIDNVLDFSSATASDMMKPRTSVVAMDVDATEEEMMELLKENRYSRIPVYEDSIDNIIGILYMKDVVRLLAGGEAIDLRSILRDAYFIGESAVADRIFHEMKARNLSIAVVVDEYAGTSGIITMEDILEELVGNIDDEYDLENTDVILLENGVYLIDPELRIDEVNDYFHLSLSSEKSDSIGGFVIELLDRIPKQGEVVRYGDLLFTVNEMQGLKLTKLKMKLESDV